MGIIRLPADVKLFIAVTFNSETLYAEVQNILEEKYGPIEIRSAVYDFIFSQYYSREMGFDLKKQLLGFKQLIRPEKLVDIKLETNDIENVNATDGNRNINIDPGYLTGAKVVLATTKNFDHRIYLGKGIFGDVHLRYRGNRFIMNDWTYPDYKEMYVIEFLARLRRSYMIDFRRMEDERKQEEIQ